jgi:hypothetical protein
MVRVVNFGILRYIQTCVRRASWWSELYALAYYWPVWREPADGLSCMLWHTTDLCEESQLMVWVVSFGILHPDLCKESQLMVWVVSSGILQTCVKRASWWSELYALAYYRPVWGVPADGLSCRPWHTTNLCEESQLMVWVVSSGILQTCVRRASWWSEL